MMHVRIFLATFKRAG